MKMGINLDMMTLAILEGLKIAKVIGLDSSIDIRDTCSAACKSFCNINLSYNFLIV